MKFLTLLLISVSYYNCAISTSLNSISTSSTSLNSISNASESVSAVSSSIKSISNSITSISGSLSGGDDKKSELYRSDIKELVALHYQNGWKGGFENDLKNIAYRNGILYWRSEKSTFRAIGAGLKSAGASNVILSRVQKEIGENSEISRLLAEGYESF